MCTKFELKPSKMQDLCECEDTDDENLLLDDQNLSWNRCEVCRRKKQTNGLINHTMRRISMDNEEDEPLLIPDHVNSMGNIVIRDFHCHTHFQKNENLRAYKTLWIVSVLCFLFMITEIVGGYLASSLAIMTDAAHLFSDLVGFLVSIVSIWIGTRPPTSSMTFGYHRAEVMGAFLSVLAVWLLAGVFSILAVNRIISHDDDINADTMLITAGLGLIINIVMGTVLHGFCIKSHTHSHGLIDHSHNNNINIRAAAAHVIGDLMQSLGVLVAAIVIKFQPNAWIADPICTILFSLIAIVATLRVAKDTVLLLIEASPICSKEMFNELKKINGVKHVHSLHIWSLAPGREAVATHLAVDETCDRDMVLHIATNVVKNKFNVLSCTIQIEAYNHEQMSICTECQLLQS